MNDLCGRYNKPWRAFKARFDIRATNMTKNKYFRDFQPTLSTLTINNPATHTHGSRDRRVVAGKESGTIWLEKVAGVTGLEPAASGVTGQRSNQLSYTPARRVGAPCIHDPSDCQVELGKWRE